MNKKALITGIGGQDGSYLAELLLRCGYEVHGTIRRASQFNTQRIDHLYLEPWDPNCKLFLHRADMVDSSSLHHIVAKIQPDEIYNLAAQSHVGVSFEIPEYTYQTIANGTLALLEAMREFCPHARFYQASSSEMFGNSPAPQNERSKFDPRSPYAVAKVAAYYQVRNYRDCYGLFASNGILFNHESPRRGETFVTRKITRGLARIKCGLQDKIRLGCLTTKRDWGFAGEYVKAMQLILNYSQADDFVIATGKTYSVHEFLLIACELAGLEPSKIVEFDERLLRPGEVQELCGEPTKAARELKWTACADIRELALMMYNHDLAIAQKETK